MIPKIKHLTAATLFALMTASSAFAGTLEVGGNLANVTLSNQPTNLAIGVRNDATQYVGAVGADGSTSVDVGGNLTNVTLSNQPANLAIGVRNTACQDIGSVGKAC